MDLPLQRPRIEFWGRESRVISVIVLFSMAQLRVIGGSQHPIICICLAKSDVMKNKV